MADETQGPGTMTSSGKVNEGAAEAAGRPINNAPYDPSVANSLKTKEELAAEAGNGPKDPTTGKVEVGDPIDLRAKTTIYSTDKDLHHRTGEAFSVHPKVAKDAIANGFAATSKEAAEKWKPKGGDK